MNSKRLLNKTTLALIIAISVTFNTYAVDLVGEWTFDNNNTADTSVYVNNGQVTGSVGFVNDADRGGVAYFDGSSYITAGHIQAYEITDAVAVSVWLKSDSVADWAGIVGKWTFRLVHAANLQTPGFYIDGVTQVFNSNYQIFDGQWHHVVGSYDRSKAKLYIDGQLVSVDSATSPIAIRSDLPFDIGRDANNNKFRGYLDNVRFYHGTLTDQQVKNLFNDADLSAATPVEPLNSAVNVDVNTSLSWLPGTPAAGSISSFKIYFSNGYDAVYNGTVSPVSVGAGQSSYDVSGLTNDTTYYWRVDELLSNSSIVRGPVFAFTTATARDHLLTSYWSFDENSGNTAANSVGGGNLAVSDTVWAQGLSGGGLKFDGYDSLAENTGFAAVDNVGYSVSVWVNFKYDVFAQSSGMTIVNVPADGGPRISVNEEGSGRIGFYVNDTTIALYSKVSYWQKDQWYNIAVTYDGKNYALYINGQYQGQCLSGVVPAISAGIEVGNNLAGTVDELKIFNYKLSNEEVAALYTGFAGGQVCVENPEYDFDADCIVNIADFAMFADNWMSSFVIN